MLSRCACCFTGMLVHNGCLLRCNFASGQEVIIESMPICAISELLSF